MDKELERRSILKYYSYESIDSDVIDIDMNGVVKFTGNLKKNSLSSRSKMHVLLFSIQTINNVFAGCISTTFSLAFLMKKSLMA